MAEKRINGGMGAMVGRLDGKAALVVGAGTAGGGWGNGKAAAVLFAREGAHVFAVDRDPAAAEETRCIIEGEGGVCAAHRADVTHSADAAAMAAACVDAFGRIDVLHNNVGGSDPGGPVEMDEATWDTAIDHQSQKRVPDLQARAAGHEGATAAAPSSMFPRWRGFAPMAVR